MELFDFTFLHSQMFWLALCFVVLLGFMQKFAVPVIAKSLDARAEQIKQDLADAESLKNQAQEMLEQYNNKMQEANKQAQEILEQAKQNAKELNDKRSAELEQSLKDKAEQAEKRIESAQRKAIKEIQTEASKIAILATEKLVLETVNAKKAKELTTKAVEELAN